MNKQNKQSKPGRTPQDKINRHVAFALHNSEWGILPDSADNLPPEVLQTLANWYKKLRHLNSLPLDNLLWNEGICRSCLSAVDFMDNPVFFGGLIKFRNNLLKSWPKFSGDPAFPIKGCNTAYIYIKHTAEYKQLRKELSLYCIAELEELLIPQYSFGNFPLEHRIKILKILKKLYRLPATNDSWETGLCYRITAVERVNIIAHMNYSAQHFKTWKHFSGADHNPIPREDDINNTMSRKQLRKNLCRHVIKSIEAELKYVL